MCKSILNIKTIFVFLVILAGIVFPISSFAMPTGKPLPLDPNNSRTLLFANRFSKSVCFYPSKWKDILFPMVDYASSDNCKNSSGMFLDLHNRLATRYKNAWYCLRAVTKTDLGKSTYEYVTFAPCDMIDLRQRWRYDQSQDNFVSVSNGRPLGEVKWTLAQAKDTSGVYPLGSTSKQTYKFKEWLEKAPQPVNAAYPVQLLWTQKENQFQVFPLAPKPASYNPYTQQIYLFLDNDSPRCLTSLRVKTGSSDGVTWEECDLTASQAKLEHRWRIRLPNHLRSKVDIADGQGNPLVVFNSAFSVSYFGKAVTIAADQPSSLPFPFTDAFEIGSDYYQYAIANAKNLLGMVETGFCPAPGIKPQQTRHNIQPRIVPSQVDWRQWLSRMYAIARHDDRRTGIGLIYSGDIQALEIITEVMIEGARSAAFLANPFGILYDTDTPPGTSYSSVQRFIGERHLVTDEVLTGFRQFRRVMVALQRRGNLTMNRAAALYAEQILANYNALSPQLTTSIYASQAREEEGGLGPEYFNQLHAHLNLLPRSSTFILRAAHFPIPGNYELSRRTLGLGMVESNGTIRIVPPTTLGNPAFTEEEYYRRFNGGRITSGAAIQNFLEMAMPVAGGVFHTVDVFRVDRRAPPPSPTTASVGTQTELSAGNCTASTQTDLSGDGAGFSRVRVNYCFSETGRCMDQ